MLILLPLWMLAVAAQTTDDGSRIYFENELPLFKAKTPVAVPQMAKENVNLSYSIHNRQIVSKGLREMAINLDHLIRNSFPDENTLFSPIPIANAMGMLLLGAKGKTAQEISSLFGNNPEFDVARRPNLLHEELGSLVDDLILQPGISTGSEVSVGAAVFPNKWYGIKNSYIEKAKRIYHSDIIPLDYIYRGEEAKKIINKWVSNSTNNRITSILDRAPHPSTSIVLVSAIYFNCEWKYPFNEMSTKERPFYTGVYSNGEEEFIKVQMMVNSSPAQYFEDKSLQIQLLGLPYKGEGEGEIYMYIYLPEGDLKQSLSQLRESDLKSMINSCKNKLVVYMLPKMKLEAKYNLETILPALGVTSLFNPSNGGLDDIAPRAYVNEIIHKVEIEVTESGTTASAVTAGSVNRGGFTPVVRVDKPFLFFIHHVKTDSFLFYGAVTRPTPHSSPKG